MTFFFSATYVHSVKMVSYQNLSLSSRFGFGLDRIVGLIRS